MDRQAIRQAIERMAEMNEALEARLGAKTAKILTSTAKQIMSWKVLHDLLCGKMGEGESQVFHLVQETCEVAVFEVMARALIDPKLFDGKPEHEAPLEAELEKWTEELKQVTLLQMKMGRV